MDFANNVDFSLKILFPILFLLIVLEYARAKHLYDWKESAQGFGIASIATLIAVFNKKFLALASFVFLFEFFKPIRAELLGYESLGWAWYTWIICLLLDDFNFYWHHRFSHSVRLLWAAHSPHHNGKKFNLTVSIRNGWFITFFKFLYWLWLPIVGFEPVMIATCLLINSAYQFFLHSQLVPSLGSLEYIFNTPWLHQVHHSSNTEYLDKNHAGIFIFWDRIFGTFQDCIPNLKPKYGVIHDPNSYNPIKANTFEFEEIWKDMKKTKSIKNKLKYMFYPPGWSHDGSTMTAKEMQASLQMTGKDPQDEMHKASYC